MNSERFGAWKIKPKPKDKHAVALGRKGGKAKGKPKGFAAMTLERAFQIRQMAIDRLRYIQARGIPKPICEGCGTSSRVSVTATGCLARLTAICKPCLAALNEKTAQALAEPCNFVKVEKAQAEFVKGILKPWLKRHKAQKT